MILGLTPRSLISVRTAAIMALIGGTVLTGAFRWPNDAGVLTHGPIVGGVSEHQAVVFGRLSQAGVARVAYTDSRFWRNVQLSAPVEASQEGDFTVRIPLNGLQPATTYRYRIVTGAWPGVLTKTAQFSTAPLPDSNLSFSFAVFSDLSTLNVGAPAYASAAAHGPSFALQIGDFDHRNPGAWPGEPKIERWRRMHRDVLGDSLAGQDLQQQIAASIPLYHIWDDHDYGADNADRTAPWKPLAAQAFSEYYALPPLPNPDGGLWYRFRHAQAEIFMLDLRSQRDPNDLPQSPDKSILDGAEILNGQKTWLKNALLASSARWKFLVSSSGWNPKGKQVDSWAQFTDEQDEIVRFIQDHGISGVIVLSGDLHSAGGIDDGSNSIFPELSVPTTNIGRQRDCTSGECGTWSEGILTGVDPSGFALVTISYDPSTGADSVRLQVFGEDGSLRLEYLIEAP